jgi:hypothetical protein
MNVAGILHPDRVAGLDQRGGKQPEGSLEAAGDQHLLEVAIDAAGDRQVALDGPAQRRLAGRRLVGERRLGEPARPPRREPRPQLARKGVERRQPDLEGQKRAVTLAAGQRRRRRPGSAHPARHRRARQGRDLGAGRGPAGDIAFGRQELVGELHGSARGGELRRQASARRQPGARRQSPRQDGGADAVIELAAERCRQPAIESQAGKAGGQGHGLLVCCGLGPVGRAKQALRPAPAPRASGAAHTATEERP